MGNRTYRLENLVANAMHFPAVGDKDNPLFLYTKVPEYNGTSENIELTYSKQAKFSDWLRNKDNVYSSPRNIRSVYIHTRGVEVLTFEKPVGMNTKRHSRQYGIDIMSESIGGNAFKAFSSPLVCSNIEEIYIDYNIVNIMLNNEESITNKLSSIGVDANEIHMIENNSGIARSELPKALLDISNDGNFQRIRTIAITRGVYSGNESKFIIEPNDSNRYARTYEARADEMKESGCCMLVSRINDNNSNYGKLSVSPNIYLFDRNILQSTSDEFNRKFKEIVNKSKTNTDDTVNKEADTLIKEVVRLRESYGDKIADMIINTAMSTMRKDDKAQVAKIVDSIK